MKLKISRTDLLSSVKLTARTVAKRTTNPILTCVKLTVSPDGFVSVSGTDLETSLVSYAGQLPSEIDSDTGSVILPPDRLITILSACADESVEIKSDPGDGVTYLVLTDADYELPYMDPDGFPGVPAFDGESDFSVPTADFQLALKRVSYAVDRQESTRYAVTGVAFAVESPGVLKLVGTDTKRLNVYQVCEVDREPITALVPIGACSAAVDMLVPNGKVDIKLTNNTAYFRTDSAVLYTKLIEGRFPPYNQIFPKSSLRTLDIPLSGFAAKLKQSVPVADNETKRVTLEFTDESITFSCRGASSGKSRVRFGYDGYTGKDISISFDSQYLSEMCKNLDGEENIKMAFSDPGKPVVFSGGGVEALIMPLSEG